jgi:hypothetical protein
MAKKKTRQVPPSPADFSSALSGYEKESREAEAKLDDANRLKERGRSRRENFNQALRIRQK